MRFAISILITVLLSARSSALTGLEMREKAERALEDATAWYDQNWAICETDEIEDADSCPLSTMAKLKVTPVSEEIHRGYLIHEHAMKTLMTEDKFDFEDAHKYLLEISSGICNKNIVTNCDCMQYSKYRTYDGTCNNVEYPTWGAAGTAQERLAPPCYDDNKDTPRGGYQSTLPNPRKISTTCHSDLDVKAFDYSNIVPMFGQYLAHDFVNTPTTTANGSCCDGNPHPNCYPIAVPEDDEFFTSTGRSKCMEFTRSAACVNKNNGQREQLNTVTAFIDSSHIYGSSKTLADALRSFHCGKMLESSEGFLPFANQTAALIALNIRGPYICGDARCNQVPNLAVMHMVWLKEHNRIAEYFCNVKPCWSDEKIYQETRRIVAALNQQVTYSEYLLATLGPATMSKFHLYLPKPGQYSKYDPKVNPSTLIEHSTAAYRFGHAMVSNRVTLIDSCDLESDHGDYLVQNNFFIPDQITQNGGQGFNWILGGYAVEPCQDFNRWVSVSMTNFLYSQPFNPGGDLAARNDHRTRDNGMCGYKTYRELITGTPFTYDSAPKDIKEEDFETLKSCYPDSVDDIDLWSGGLHEIPVPDASSGITFNTIKAEQFKRLKYGDRHFFTHRDQPGEFTRAQLKVLRKQTLGDIICRNSDLQYLQENVFHLPCDDNPLKRCKDRSRHFDLKPFLWGEDECNIGKCEVTA